MTQLPQYEGGGDDPLAFDVIDRMRKSLRVSGHSVHSIAAAMGVHPNTVGNYLHGRTHPSRPTLTAWAVAVGHGVTREWLETGQGPPFVLGGRLRQLR